MKKSIKKILRAIESTENWVNQYEKKLGHKPDKYTSTGLIIYGCEVRNLEEYKEMLLVKDKRKLNGRLKKLYFAI